MDDIPDFAKPLAPFVASRQETLKIRQSLTCYLRSRLKSVDNGPIGHLSASTGCNVDSVTGTPSEFGSGIHTRYLEALRTNLAARGAYNEALRDFNALKQEQDRKPRTNDRGLSGGQELQAYLAVLRTRRERERMQLLRRYLDKLDAMEAAQSGYLALDQYQEEETARAAEGLQPDNSPDSAMPPDDGVETIVQALERNVLQAKHRLDLERKKRDAALSRRPNANSVDTMMRLKALTRVRDELVLWVEEKLANASNEDSVIGSGREGDASTEGSSPLLTTKKQQIEEQYKKYVAARQSLLHTLYVVSCELPRDDKRIPVRHPRAVEPSQEIAQDRMALLGRVCQKLLPLSEAQKAAVMQRSYLSSMLDKERRTTAKALDRLREDSHLLPEHMAAADEVDLAEAWVSASAAVGHATNDYVEEEVAIGTEMAQNAEDALQDLYGTMNGDYVRATTESTENKDASGARFGTARSRRNTRRGTLLQTPLNNDPWSHLDGKVGVIGDG